MQTCKSRRSAAGQKEAGFSLPEFLVETVVMLIMVTLGLSLLDQGQTLFRNQSAALVAQARVRKALNLMVADLSLTGCTPVSITAGNTPGVLSGTATSIRVVADRNGSGTTNNSTGDINDDVTYTFANGAITRTAASDPAYQSGGTAQPVTLIDNVSSLTITYFDSAGNTLTAPLSSSALAQVARLQLSIVTSVRELGQTTGTVTVETPVVLRNRQLNTW